MNDAASNVIADVTSLTDRRRIASLEAANADLERKLAAAMQCAEPALMVARGECSHFAAPLVSDRTPSVTCSECEAELDPYEVLRKIAHREVNFCYSLNALRDEAKRLNEEVRRLKAARARLRRSKP